MVKATLSNSWEVAFDAKVMREDRVILLVDGCLTMYFHLILLGWTLRHDVGLSSKC